MQYRVTVAGKKVLLPAHVSKQYKVSRPTAGSWVEEALKKQNNLEILTEDGRHYIADTIQNHRELSLLKERGLKYKNKIGYEKAVVTKDLTDFLETTSVKELINYLEVSDTPGKFLYYGKLAESWFDFYVETDGFVDSFSQSFIRIFENYLAEEKTTILNFGLSTPDQLDLISKTLGEFSDVSNVTNVFPAKPTSMPKSSKYISGDLEESGLASKLPKSVDGQNIFLCLGGGISRFYQPTTALQNIASSMGVKDVLWVDALLDNELTDKFVKDYAEDKRTHDKVKTFLSKLGISESSFNLSRKYDPEHFCHVLEAQWEKDLDIILDFDNKNYEVSFIDGESMAVESIQVFQPLEVSSLLENSGFEILAQALSPNGRDIHFLVRKA